MTLGLFAFAYPSEGAPLGFPVVYFYQNGIVEEKAGLEADEILESFAYGE